MPGRNPVDIQSNPINNTQFNFNLSFIFSFYSALNFTIELLFHYLPLSPSLFFITNLIKNIKKRIYGEKSCIKIPKK